MESRKIIFVEGIWGSGKTSTIFNLQNAFVKSGIQFSYISDESNVLNNLYMDNMEAGSFLTHYEKAWDRLISANASNKNLIFEGGLFTGLTQHWLEHEMPSTRLVDYLVAKWSSLQEKNVYLVYLAPKNIEKSWNDITTERGSAWTRFMETTVLQDTNQERITKIPSIKDYVYELDSLYRQIYIKLVNNKIQIHASEDSWCQNMSRIYTFLGLDSVDTGQTGMELCGTYENGDIFCQVRSLGNCLQIKDIFGKKELIMYLYSQGYPIDENEQVDFSLPTFGKVTIKFRTENSNKVFYISHVKVEDNRFTKQFRLLKNTKWIKKKVV